MPTDYQLHLCWEEFGALGRDILRLWERSARIPLSPEGCLLHDYRNACRRLGRQEPVACRVCMDSKLVVDHARSSVSAMLRVPCPSCVATPTGPIDPEADPSKQVASALEKSKPLVKEALKLGRSISGADPTLGVIGLPAAKPTKPCATCGGARNIVWQTEDGTHEAPCPDCTTGRGGT